MAGKGGLTCTGQDCEPPDCLPPPLTFDSLLRLSLYIYSHSVDFEEFCTFFKIDPTKFARRCFSLLGGNKKIEVCECVKAKASPHSSYDRPVVLLCASALLPIQRKPTHSYTPHHTCPSRSLCIPLCPSSASSSFAAGTSAPTTAAVLSGSPSSFTTVSFPLSRTHRLFIII